LANLYFSSGQLHKVQTREPFYLAAVLHELGSIDAAVQNEGLLAVARERKLFGQALLERGRVTLDALQLGLRAQMERKVTHTLTFEPECNWSFASNLDALAAYGGDDWPLVDPRVAVWNGVRSRPFSAAMGDLLVRAVGRRMRLVKDSKGLVALGVNDPQLLDRFAAGFAVETRHVDGKDAEISKLVYFLLVARFLVVERDSQGSLPAMRAALSSRPGHVTVTEKDSVVPVSQTLPARRAEPSFQMPVPEGIRRPSPVPVSGSAERRISSVPVPNASTAGRTISSSLPPAKSPAARTEHLSAAERRSAVHEAYDRLATLNHYEVLGVAEDVTTEALRARFFRLSREWHPDKWPTELDDVRLKAQRIYQSMLTAFRTLVEPDTRATYDAKLAREDGAAHAAPKSGPGDSKPPEKQSLRTKVEILLGRGELAQARELCKGAMKLAPDDGEYLALYAHVRAQDAAFVDDVFEMKRVIDMFDDAVTRAPMAPLVYLYRGLAHKRRGGPAAAIRDFRTVVELDPENTDAARELRIFRMRRQNGASVADALRPSEPPRRASVSKLLSVFTKK
jgi:tetratricopeptide (TPR) repeat protein